MAGCRCLFLDRLNFRDPVYPVDPVNSSICQQWSLFVARKDGPSRGFCRTARQEVAIPNGANHRVFARACRSQGGVSPKCSAKNSMKTLTRGSIKRRGGMTA
jgi:hypothetical protein